AVMSHGRHLLFGAGADGEPAQRTPSIVKLPLIGGLVACAALGIVAWPLASLLHAAARVVAL
ncbi:MAG: proton-conducting transporter membrane subunit, partial [Acidimicrobiales bacterium]